MTKPPPQALGVQGFDAHAAMGADAPTIDLDKLLRHPPFQKYAAEREPNLVGAAADVYAETCLRRAVERGELQQYIAAYVKWHGKTGYWPDESPFGITNGSLEA